MITKLPRWIWFGGIILAFSAGIINAIALMSFAQQAATHVTGIFTHLSMNIFKGDSHGIQTSVYMLLSFLCGAILCGCIIMDGHLKMGRRYGVALLVECALLLMSTYAFNKQSIWGEYFACMAAGLQNAMVSTYSGTIVRTTHMTGILTDFGALLGQMLRGVRVQSLRLRILFWIMTGFFGGGFIGVYAYTQIGYFAMLIPSIITGLTALTYFWILARSHPNASTLHS